MRPNDPDKIPTPDEPADPPRVRSSAGYLKTPALRARGWTETLIRRFLPAPDAEMTNPNNRSGPPIRLYRPGRVEAVETGADFQAAVTRSAGRRAGAAQAVETKREALLAYVEGLVVEVPAIPPGELVRRACDHANFRSRDDAEPFTAESDPDHVARICVNYLRHEMTDYEAELEKIAGKVGVADAYLEIRAKVFEAIGEAYPDLDRECSRQQRKGEEEASWAEIQRRLYR